MSRIKNSTVVVGVDGSVSADAALVWAADEARRRQARLRIVHAIGEPATASAPLAEVERDMAWSVLTKAIVDLEDVDVSVEPCLVVGRPAPVLIDQAKNASMIVVGSRGSGGFKGLLLGSVSHAVLQCASSPVAIVRTIREETS